MAWLCLEGVREYMLREGGCRWYDPVSPVRECPDAQDDFSWPRGSWLRLGVELAAGYCFFELLRLQVRNRNAVGRALGFHHPGWARCGCCGQCMDGGSVLDRRCTDCVSCLGFCFCGGCMYAAQVATIRRQNEYGLVHAPVRTGYLE